MGDHEYWVRLADDKAELGGGFIVTRRHVVTAAHCVGRLRPGSSLTVSTSNGTTIQAILEELIERRDLALLRLETPVPWMPPGTGHCRPSDRWFAPYRPSVADPHLAGSVIRHDVEYKCEGGDLIPAIQLDVSVELGDYSGYSGGPVERHDEVGGNRVVGLLIEQFPDRVDSKRFTNVLFAAELGRALRCFEAFELDNLAPVLFERRPMTEVPQQKAPRRWRLTWLGGRGKPSGAKASRRADTEADLVAAQRWGELGLMPEDEVRTLRLRIARRFLDE